MDRFQRQKVADLREMAISMARSHRDWCKKVISQLKEPVQISDAFNSIQNLEAWEEAKNEIEKIPDHPNKASPPQQPGVGGAGTAVRRDSVTTVNGR